MHAGPDGRRVSHGLALCAPEPLEAQPGADQPQQAEHEKRAVGLVTTLGQRGHLRLWRCL